MKLHPAFALSTAAVVAVALVWAVVGLFGAFTATDGGTVSVIRNGGLFDNRAVRQVDGQPQIVQPGSSLTYTGMFSAEHPYPATQRYFKVSAGPDADSNEIINVPSRDGVSLGIEGTFYFELNRDPNVLAQFDDKFGTRTFPVVTERNADGTPATTEQLHAWEGDPAWSAFLGATLGNLVQNDLRREVGRYTCTDLIATCALAQNTAGSDAAAVIAAAQANPAASDKITEIQEAVNAQFASDVTATLGGPYFTGIRFVLSKVALPPNVQDAINAAQGAFAQVTEASARKQAAQVDSEANAIKQQGYERCPTCAQIDLTKALPPGLTTYAPGSQFAVTPR